MGTLAELEIVPVLGESDTSINKSCAILEGFGVEYLVLCDGKALGTDVAHGPVNDTYRERCIVVPEEDTGLYLQKRFGKEFDECEKELNYHREKDMGVLRCVLGRVEPPEPVVELAERIKELLKRDSIK